MISSENTGDAGKGGTGVLALARRLALPSVAAGLLGGLFMIAVMVVIMGASGMGYATPITLGMSSFIFSSAPPAAMLPTLVAMTGAKLPAPLMNQLTINVHSGTISSAMIAKVVSVLQSGHLPPAKIHALESLMQGNASNSTVASFLGEISSSSRAAVMSAMPVSISHVIVGLLLQLAFSAFLGVLFFLLIGLAAYKLPFIRRASTLVLLGTAGGIVVYIVSRVLIFPMWNPVMGLFPQEGFFFADCLFGFVVGAMIADVFQRSSIRDLFPIGG